jgi:hypothetical protein
MLKGITTRLPFSALDSRNPQGKRISPESTSRSLTLSGAIAERFGAWLAVSALALAGLVVVAVVGAVQLPGRNT